VADFTTTGLLANIRRRAMLPAATATGTADADLLALANDELWLNVAADILKTREEFNVTYSDTTVSGVEYRIPYRALGNSVRLAELTDSSGRRFVLTRLRPEQVENWAGSGAAPFGFYLRGGYLVLVPSATSSLTTLRMTYAARPSELTSSAADYGVISAINTSTGVVTFGSGASFSTSVGVDFVSSRAPFDVMAAEVALSAATGTTVTAATASSLPTGLRVGDYVCVPGKSPVPTIPQEWHAVLAIRTAQVVCRALGDFDAVTELDKQLASAERDAGMAVLTPRTPGNVEKGVARVNALSGGRRWGP
jgi:hypothetical protein